MALVLCGFVLGIFCGILIELAHPPHNGAEFNMTNPWLIYGLPAIVVVVSGIACWLICLPAIVVEVSGIAWWLIYGLPAIVVVFFQRSLYN